MNTTPSGIYRYLDIDLEKFSARAGEFGFRLGSPEDLAEAMLMAERLVGGKLASAEQVAEMNRITGMTAWVTGDPVDGVFLTLPLTRAGEDAVLDGSYCAASPDPAHLAHQGRGTVAFYTGVYAGATKDARRRIMTAAATFRLEVYASLPGYARAATEDGKRSMLFLGCKPVSGGLPDLYRLDPVGNFSNVAAE